MTDQINNMFTYHAPKPDQIPKYDAIGETAKAFAHLIDSSQPDSREKSAALTLLQNATMMAKAGIACNT